MPRVDGLAVQRPEGGTILLAGRMPHLFIYLHKHKPHLHEVVYDDDVLAGGVAVLDGDAAGLAVTDLVRCSGAARARTAEQWRYRHRHQRKRWAKLTTPTRYTARGDK